jgi:thymidylate kinase
VGFNVLLGADYAGKTSVMRALRRDLGLHLVEVEGGALDELRRLLMREVWGAYSPEFVTGLLQLAVIHTRDSLCDDALVDSYYYKILAKCRLTGVDSDHPMFDWWRTFPQPRRVIYLEVPTEEAWRRSGFGADLNPLEHYGSSPSRLGFEAYQRDLRKLMFEELVGLSVEVLEAEDSVDRTAEAVKAVIHEGH